MKTSFVEFNLSAKTLLALTLALVLFVVPTDLIQAAPDIIEESEEEKQEQTEKIYDALFAMVTSSLETQIERLEASRELVLDETNDITQRKIDRSDIPDELAEVEQALIKAKTFLSVAELAEDVFSAEENIRNALMMIDEAKNHFAKAVQEVQQHKDTPLELEEVLAPKEEVEVVEDLDEPEVEESVSEEATEETADETEGADGEEEVASANSAGGASVVEESTDTGEETSSEEIVSEESENEEEVSEGADQDADEESADDEEIAEEEIEENEETVTNDETATDESEEAEIIESEEVAEEEVAEESEEEEEVLEEIDSEQAKLEEEEPEVEEVEPEPEPEPEEEAPTEE